MDVTTKKLSWGQCKMLINISLKISKPYEYINQDIARFAEVDNRYNKYRELINTLEKNNIIHIRNYISNNKLITFNIKKLKSFIDEQEIVEKFAEYAKYFHFFQW